MITSREIAHLNEIINTQGKLINKIRNEFLATGEVDLNDLGGLGKMDRIQKLIHDYEGSNANV